MKQTIALIISQVIITIGGFTLMQHRLDLSEINRKVDDTQTVLIKGFMCIEKDLKQLDKDIELVIENEIIITKNQVKNENSSEDRQADLYKWLKIINGNIK